ACTSWLIWLSSTLPAEVTTFCTRALASLPYQLATIARVDNRGAMLASRFGPAPLATALAAAGIAASARGARQTTAAARSPSCGRTACAAAGCAARRRGRDAASALDTGRR